MENESSLSRQAFLFAPQFHKSRDNHPHAGRKNRGGKRRIPQIPFRFSSLFFSNWLLCVAP
jgi:hypothetical protein